MVFELSSAVAQHHTFRLAAWNTFKLVSFYRPALNMSVAVVGSAPGAGPGIVILDNIVITIDTSNKSFV